jgi:hypothetical protein
VVAWILFGKKKTLIGYIDEMEEEKEGFDIMLLIIPAVLYMLFVAVGLRFFYKGTVSRDSYSERNCLLGFLF